MIFKGFINAKKVDVFHSFGKNQMLVGLPSFPSRTPISFLGALAAPIVSSSEAWGALEVDVKKRWWGG